MSKPTQGIPASLSAPIDATQTSFSIRGLKDSRGTAITAMIGTIMHATIEPRSTVNQEIVSWTGITNLGNNLVTVTGVVRNYNPQTPYNAMTGAVPHAAGAEIILSDTSKMWSEYLNLNEVNTVNAQQNFAVRPRSTGADTDPTALVTKAELAAAAITPGALGNITVSAVAGESVSLQNVVWLDPAVGKWKVANGNVQAELEGTELGIALGSAITDAAITPGVAVRGRVSGFTGLSIGAVYVSNTGTISNTPGTVSLQVGIAVSATDILFDPYFANGLTVNQRAALAGTQGTPSATNKFVTADGLALAIKSDGSDGALAVSSGTTTIDLAGARYVLKQYTTVSITGSGKVAFSNPHANGSIVEFRSQGNATLTSSSTSMIDVSGIGGAAGTGNANAAGTAGSDGGSFYIIPVKGDVNGDTNVGGTGGPAVIASGTVSNIFPGEMKYVVGAGGAGGHSNASNLGNAGGAGGRGGGCFVLRCFGALNFTTGSIDARGKDGSAATGGGAGGGGAGGGGSVFLFYRTLTANTATILVAGGAGGTAASGSAGQGSGGGGGGASITAGTNGSNRNGPGTAGGGGGNGGTGLSSVLPINGLT